MTPRSLLYLALATPFAFSRSAHAEPPNPEEHVDSRAAAPEPNLAEVPPASAPLPPPTPLPHDAGLSPKERRGLALAGSLTLGLPYMFTSLAGAIAIDKADDDRSRRYGRSLLVPVVGPFFAIRHTDSAVRRWGAAFSGTLQVAALSLVTAAVISTVRRKRGRRFGPTAAFHPGGAAIGIAGRF